MIVITHTAVDKFIDDLDPTSRAKTILAVDRLGKFGPHLPPPDSKKIGKELFELRTRAEVQVRLFYGFRKEKVFIVHGIIKKTGKIPKRDVALAQRRLSALA